MSIIGDYLSSLSIHLARSSIDHDCSLVVLPHLLAKSDINKTPNLFLAVIQSIRAYVTSIAAEGTFVSTHIGHHYTFGPTDQVDELVAAPLSVCCGTSEYKSGHDEVIWE